MTAVLFADPAQAKTAVYLHQTAQKAALGPASQAACHEAKRPRPRTQDSVQAPSLTDWPLAWLSAKTHAPACLPFGEKWRGVWSLPASSAASGWEGRAQASDRHETPPRPQIGNGKNRVESFHGALMFSRTSETFPSSFIHCASSSPVYYVADKHLEGRYHLLCVTEGAREAERGGDSAPVTRAIRSGTLLAV